jgi:integrase
MTVGTIFRPKTTHPLPRGAEITERDGKRTARWRNAHGVIRTAEVRETGRGTCIVRESMKYLARFRDGENVVRTVSTGCSDRAAANAKLVEFVRRAEMVRAGVLSPAEDACSDHRRTLVGRHVEDFLASLRARGNGERHVRNIKRLLNVVLSECQIRALRDIKRETIERWLTSGSNVTRAARTRNMYLGALRSLMKWCIETERLLVDPTIHIRRADESVDRRRVPRALSEDELVRLLDAARRRPLAEALKFNRGWRKGQNGARLRPETYAKLEQLGHARSLIYKTLVLTGLRLGELAAIRVCDVEGDHIVLDARHEKNRRGSMIPLRPDLAQDLRAWIGERREGLLFDVSPNLVKVFDRDLKFAGIAKRDERNRTACVHSLRHSFATLMSCNGVAPRVAQAAMRHSTMDLTMRVYTDPKLLDVASALDALPELCLAAGPAPAAGSDDGPALAASPAARGPAASPRRQRTAALRLDAKSLRRSAGRIAASQPK